MLLVLRRILEARSSLPLRAGVAQGPCFARDVAYSGRRSVSVELHAAAGERLERAARADAGDEAAQLSLHFHHAGALEKAWHYGRRAADRAHMRSAFADAAALYRRALDSVRSLDVPPHELATVWESLAHAYVRTRELDRAEHALTTARRLVHDDPLRTAHLMWLHARIAERFGHGTRAVR